MRLKVYQKLKEALIRYHAISVEYGHDPSDINQNRLSFLAGFLLAKVETAIEEMETEGSESVAQLLPKHIKTSPLAELTIVEGENRTYARAAAQELANSLEDPIERAVALIQEDPSRKVRLSLSVVFAIHEESGEIRPEYTVKRSQAEEAKHLPGIPLGPQTTLWADEDFSKQDR